MINPVLRKLKIYCICLFVACSFLSSAQTIKLPGVRSNIYADTFGLYWGHDICYRKSDQGNLSNYTVYVKFQTIFEDTLFTITTTDTLAIFPFDQDYANERAFQIICVFKLKDSKKAKEYKDVVVKLLPRNDKIEALRSLVSTNTSLQNLELLADAYESEACYANAYYIYWQMLSIDSKLGKEKFNKFYQRNFKVLNHPCTYQR
jgi:hypothetical protein